MEPTSQPSRGREPRTEGRAMIANPENRQDCPRTAAGCRDDGSTVPRPGSRQTAILTPLRAFRHGLAPRQSDRPSSYLITSSVV